MNRWLLILTVLLFWMYFYFLILAFVLQWPSFHCEILNCCLNSHWLSFKLKSRCSFSTHSMYLFFCWFKWFLMIIQEMFHGKISLVVSAAASEFVGGTRLELMYISVNIRSSLIHFRGFQLLVLLLYLKEICKSFLPFIPIE